MKTGRNTTILIVDDEETIRESVAAELSRAGYDTVQVASVAEAEQVISRNSIGLVVLDIGLPDGSGLDLLRSTTLPVVIISGQTSEMDRVVGLELGADDYVSKPFSRRELVARVGCVLRRSTESRADDEETILTFPGLSIDCCSRQVAVEGETVDLTRLEFDLLHCLASHPKQVFSKCHLLETVWGSDESWLHESTVTEHVRRLRNKIHRTGSKGPQIVTVWGVGYRFEPSSDLVAAGGLRSAEPA